jgi:glycosyltransferase involved in cell wall biosynthesis
MQATANTPNPINEKLILPSPLKVLHIISGDLWAGAEVQAYTLLTSLPKECELLAVLMNHGELEQRLVAAGINTHVIDERNTSSLKIISKLITVIRQFAPDVIHTHRQKENILGTIANLISSPFNSKHPWRRIKSIRTTHGAPEHNASGIKNLQIWLDHFCGNYLQDAIISVSNDLAIKLQINFPEHKIHIIENGIDIKQLLQADPASDIRAGYEKAFHIGIIGRLEPVKRVDLFIRTAQSVLARSPVDAIRFHIIGDGTLRTELEALSAQLGLIQQIVFHGHRTDATQAIAALDMAVMCSDHEGTPMTALETLALGKPLIAHKVGGLTEILSEHTELLVVNHSPEGYSNAILQLMQHPSKVQLKKVYTSNINAARTLALYNNIGGGNPVG